MTLFENCKGYATRKGALAKLLKVLPENRDGYNWIIHAKEDGRFVPVVTHVPHGEVKASLIHHGIGVVG